MNDCLAAALGLEEVLPFAAGEDGIPMGRVGTLPRAVSPAEFAAAAAERLGAPVRYNRGRPDHPAGWRCWAAPAGT